MNTVDSQGDSASEYFIGWNRSPSFSFTFWCRFTSKST
jgi:hypothetical protein